MATVCSNNQLIVHYRAYFTALHQINKCKDMHISPQHTLSSATSVFRPGFITAWAFQSHAFASVRAEDKEVCCTICLCEICSLISQFCRILCFCSSPISTISYVHLFTDGLNAAALPRSRTLTHHHRLWKWVALSTPLKLTHPHLHLKSITVLFSNLSLKPCTISVRMFISPRVRNRRT